jgi:pimeloyl-ACP methyl ester carboxylesterase
MSLVATPAGGVDIEQTGQGRDLVLLHSLLTDRTAFDRVRSRLEKRHRLTLVNLPGYGRSAAGGDSVEAYADRIADVLGALKLSRETDVLGNGLGGFISVALAIRHGDRFRRLVVVDALAGFPEPGKAPLRALAQVVQQNGMSAALDTAVRRMFNPPYIQAHPEVIQERKQVLSQMDAATFAKLCVALTQVEFAPLLSRIRNRTLVIVGAQDQTTAPEFVRKLADGISGARYVEIPESGHCPQIEQPERFIDTVEAFLAEN